MKRLLVLITLSGMAVFAATLDPLNTRPYTGTNSSLTPATGEPGLNCIMAGNSASDCNGYLNPAPIYNSGAPNKLTDQSPFGMWTLNGNNTATVPWLQFEFTSNAATQTFGIFTAYDTSGPIVNVPIFKGSATGVNDGDATIALITFNLNGTYSISGDCNVVYCTAGTGASVPDAGLNPNYFGFYIDTGTQKYYSVDDLNGGQARMMAYDGPGDRWTLGFEDGTDSTESIIGVPEPAAIFLLGTLASLCAIVIRRRKRIA